MAISMEHGHCSKRPRTDMLLRLECKDATVAWLPLAGVGSAVPTADAGNVILTLCEMAGSDATIQERLQTSADAWPLAQYLQDGPGALALQLRIRGDERACVDCYKMAAGRLQIPGFLRVAESALAARIEAGDESIEAVRGRYAGFERVDVLCNLIEERRAGAGSRSVSPAIDDLLRAASRFPLLVVLYEDGACAWTVYNTELGRGGRALTIGGSAVTGDEEEEEEEEEQEQEGGRNEAAAAATQHRYIMANTQLGRSKTALALALTLGGSHNDNPWSYEEARNITYRDAERVQKLVCNYEWTKVAHLDRPLFPALDSIALVIGYNGASGCENTCVYARNMLWRTLFQGE